MLCTYTHVQLVAVRRYPYMPNECETAITDVKEDQSGIDTIGLYTAKQLVSYY